MGTKKAHLWKRGDIQRGATDIWGAVAPSCQLGSAIVLEDNVIDCLFFCATLTEPQRRPCPFAQAGAEAPDTGAEAVNPDPGSAWEGHSGWVPVCGMKMRSLVGLYAHSAFHW